MCCFSKTTGIEIHLDGNEPLVAYKNLLYVPEGTLTSNSMCRQTAALCSPYAECVWSARSLTKTASWDTTGVGRRWWGSRAADVPTLNNAIGLYCWKSKRSALKRRGRLTSYANTPTGKRVVRQLRSTVTAEIEIFGHIVAYRPFQQRSFSGRYTVPAGYRAEYARLKKLFVKDGDLFVAQGLERAFANTDVEVVYKDLKIDLTKGGSY